VIVSNFPHCRFRFWVLIVCILAGCNRSKPELIPVRGNVLFQGKPIPRAEIVLHPQFEGPGWMPVATVAEDGSFAVSTKQDGDGALPGKYKVTLSWHPRARDDNPGPNLLPARYADVSTSDLELQVGAATDEPITLRLKN
jgi:hypothetical protein